MIGEDFTWKIFSLPNAIFILRLNKALAAIFCGIALPVSGFLLQELFKNPLAEPSILGISSFSGLGVAIMVFFLGNYLVVEDLTNWFLAFSAFFGALICLFILLVIHNFLRDKNTFIIIGILLSSLASSLISFLEYFSASDSVKQFIIWSLGTFSGLSDEKILVFFSLIFSGLIISFFILRLLQGYILGENYAKSLGISVKRMEILILISCAILVSSTTAFIGPIAFVGIIIPHFCRMIWKPSDIYKQWLLNILVGISFMLIINNLNSIFTIPVNIITSFFGIPVILYILIGNKKIAK